MRLAFISPTRYIPVFGILGDFQLALAHLLDDNAVNEYEQALLSTGQQIVLDNSLFENHKPEGIDSLIRKALRIQATHFFAPDYLYDAKKTLDAAKNAIYIAKKLNVLDKVKVAAVVQASTEQEFFWLYDEYLKIPEIDLIGLSILAIPRCFGSFNKTSRKSDVYSLNEREITSSRIDCLKALLKRGGNTKSCHLLGLGDSYADVIYAARECPFVVSNDTSSAIWNGFMGKNINPDGSVEGGKTSVKVDFSLDQADSEQLNRALENIKLVKNLCK